MKKNIQVPEKLLSLAGKKEKERDVIRLCHMQRVLQEAGIQNICLDEAKGFLCFPVHLSMAPDGEFDVEYYISIAMRSQSITIVQRWGGIPQIRMRKTMQWYLERRNKEISSQGLCYSMKEDGEICLSRLGMKLSECNAQTLAAAIWELNFAAKKSYSTVHALARGQLTEEIRTRISKEYLDLESEWSTTI